MPSRPMTRANILDQCNNLLGTTLSTSWTDAKLNQIVDDVLTEISMAVPYVTRDIYQMESRNGASTSTSTNNLVDATNSQFASGDTGKMVYNTTDKTWAVITSFSSTSQVGLSRDIFTVGENYEIYNKGCWSKKQINIDNSTDYLWIIGAVYPVWPELHGIPLEDMRDVITHSRDIIELDSSYIDDTKNADADKDVYVYFARQQVLNVMTDLLGEVDLGAGYAAGLSTIHVDGLAATETIYKDSLFYFTQLGGNTADSRLIYRVTADVTLAANEGDVSFWPALESAVSDNDDITFVGSTLTPDLEQILVKIVSGEALMAQGVTKIDATAFGGATVSRTSYDIGERMAEKARRQLKSLVDVELRANHVYSRS